MPNVMRKMVTSPTGESFSINMDDTKNVNKIISIDTDNLISENLSVVVFIQSSAAKTVYQSETITYADLTISDVNTTHQIPAEYSLEQNYPNPFNPTTNIRFRIVEGGFVTLKIYNVLGNEVATLINEEKPAGNYVVTFDAAQFPSGVYFYTIDAGNFTRTKKMLFLK